VTSTALEKSVTARLWVLARIFRETLHVIEPCGSAHLRHHVTDFWMTRYPLTA
jgi:hypothetical protein